MDLLNNFFDQINYLSQNSIFLDFVDNQLTPFILVSLGFGFLVLLVEIRLPMRYYWHLPSFTFKKFIENLGLMPKTPVWGYCLDLIKNTIIPLTAIELLDADSKEVIRITYSNRLGQYGFKVRPGNYILRAIKNHYRMPPIFDPENIELVQVDESFALPITVDSVKLDVNLKLQPLEKIDPKDPTYQAWHFFKTFVLNLANGFLTLAIVGAIAGFAMRREAVFGILIAVGIIFLFIKLYILETIGQVAEKRND